MHKSVSVDKVVHNNGNCICFIPLENSETDIQTIIQAPNFFNEIKTKLKQDDERIKKARLGSKYSVSDHVSVSTSATIKRRPISAVQPNLKKNKQRLYSAKNQSQYRTSYKGTVKSFIFIDSYNPDKSISIYHGTQSGFSIMRKNSKLSVYDSTQK